LIGTPQLPRNARTCMRYRHALGHMGAWSEQPHDLAAVRRPGRPSANRESVVDHAVLGG